MPFPANHYLDSEAEECGFNKHGFLKADARPPSPNPLLYSTLPLLVLDVPTSSVLLSPCAPMALAGHVLLLVLEE